MDKKKPVKEEKVGSDGLTKKERRALKVQAKQTDDNKAELKSNQKSKEATSEVKVEDNMGPAGEEISNDARKTDTVSEKQKRKLEWEKKQAEQGKLVGKTDEKEGLSKAELKAKRREIQEAQRIAKLKADSEKNKDSIKKVIETKVHAKKPASKPEPAPEVKIKDKDCKYDNFFQHLLTPYSFTPMEKVYPAVVPNVHPAFVTFGILYCKGKLPSSNDKTIRFLYAIDELVHSLSVPAEEDFCRHLETALDNSVQFLEDRKHVTFCMQNALKAFKTFLMQLDKNTPDEEKKEELTGFIDTFIQDQIVKAGLAISLKVKEKVFDNEVLLVYGWSQIIYNILVDIHKEQRNISVVIVDSRPAFGGEEMLKEIAAIGMRHKYVMIHTLNHVMPGVTKVLLEADALMTNGNLVSKAGTAQIARMAQFCGKPVLVCCETYKFTEKEQTDGMVCNELGNSDLLLKNTHETSPLQKEENSKSTIFNLLSNLTPSNLVTAVFTELATLRCTSVPAACKAAKLLNM